MIGKIYHDRTKSEHFTCFGIVPTQLEWETLQSRADTILTHQDERGREDSSVYLAVRGGGTYLDQLFGACESAGFNSVLFFAAWSPYIHSKF
jgi:hypothetical protein